MKRRLNVRDRQGKQRNKATADTQGHGNEGISPANTTAPGTPQR